MWSKLSFFPHWIIVTDNNGKKGSDIATIIPHIYKTIDRTTCNWTPTHSYGDYNEDISWWQIQQEGLELFSNCQSRKSCPKYKQFCGKWFLTLRLCWLWSFDCCLCCLCCDKCLMLQLLLMVNLGVFRVGVLVVFQIDWSSRVFVSWRNFWEISWLWIKAVEDSRINVSLNCGVV